MRSKRDFVCTAADRGDDERMMRMWHIIKLGDERSQATLEFAIVLVLLFLLIMGIIVFGRLFSFLQVVNNAAREGARAGAVCKSDKEVIAIVKERLARIPGSDQAQIIISPAGSRIAGQPISVTVRIPFKVLWLPGVTNQPQWLTITQTMTMECTRSW